MFRSATMKRDAISKGGQASQCGDRFSFSDGKAMVGYSGGIVERDFVLSVLEALLK